MKRDFASQPPNAGDIGNRRSLKAYKAILRRAALRAHAKNENSDIEFNDHSVREPYNSDRAAYIKEKIGERIARSSVCVVYVSESTRQSDWVKWEVQESLRQGKKVVGVHPQGKDPKTTPTWVSEYGIKLVKWADLPKELK
jgi:hypothetical protein